MKMNRIVETVEKERVTFLDNGEQGQKDLGANDCTRKRTKCVGAGLVSAHASKVRPNRGITLISLIVTIIVMLILVSVTLSVVVGDDGLVAKAGEAKFKTEMANINEVYQMYVLTRTMEDVKFDVNTFNAGKKLLSYNTKPANKTGTIYDVLANCSDLYVDDLEIIKGKLYYATDNERKIKWAKEIGIEIMPYEIVDGVLISSNKNVGIVDEKTGALVIPSSVTSIGEGSFANIEGVKKIIIPSTVKEIQQNAFRGNTTLEEIIFETEVINGVEQGLEKIGNYAFMDCSNLEIIELPNTVKEIWREAFKHCSSLKIVKLSNQLTELKGAMFQECISLETIEIPEGLKIMGNDVFYKCRNLKSISFPKSLETIGKGVFTQCSNLETIEIAEGNENFASENGILFNKDKTKMIYITKTAIDGTTFEIPNTVTSLEHGLIDIYQQIEQIYIPAGVTNINVEIFLLNKNIKNIEIDSNNPNYLSENGRIYSKDKTILYLYYLNKETIDIRTETIKTIEHKAFEMCSNLKTINLPETLENIKTFAFRNNYKLDTVAIGKNIKNIDPRAFYFCRNITNMTIDPENEYYVVENNTIFSKDKKSLVTVFKDVTEYTIPEGVENVSDCAFFAQTNLTHITMPETIKKIGGYAFNMCQKLTQIEIPSSVEQIGSSCFGSCSKLEKIIIHKSKGSISGSPWGCPIGERAVEWKP